MVEPPHAIITGVRSTRPNNTQGENSMTFSTTRNQRINSMAAASAIILSVVVLGCSSEADLGTDIDSSSSQLSCDGQTGPDAETYDIGAINEELDDLGEARDRLGFDQVKTCEQARELRALQRELEPLNPDYEEASADELESESEAGGDRVPKIFNGTSTTNSYGAYLPSRGCSAFFISNKTLLTAAHCIYNNAITRSVAGLVISNFPIRYTYNGQTWDQQVRARLWRHDDYSGTGDDSDDIGLIRILDMSIARSIPIYSGSMSTGQYLYTEGWGITGDGLSNAGTLRRNRYWSQRVSRKGSNYFRSLAGANTRVCPGDSGTAITTYAGSRQVAAGIHSFSHHDDGNCAEVGTEMGHNFIEPKIPWINQRLQREGGRCSDYGDYWLCS